MTRIDMSPAAIDQRLREASRLSVLTPPFSPRVDMGPIAIERRLREVADLHQLEQRLRSAP